MTQTDPATGYSMSSGSDVVEVHLLLPAHQLSALEAAAARSRVTVGALLRNTIAELLRPPAGGDPAPPCRSPFR